MAAYSDTAINADRRQDIRVGAGDPLGKSESVWRQPHEGATRGTRRRHGNEQLAERITVVRAIVLISLPLAQEAAPCRVDRREA